VRPVAAHAIRRDQARRLGYTPLLHPADDDARGVPTVAALQDALFRRARRPAYAAQAEGQGTRGLAADGGAMGFDSGSGEDDGV